MKRSTKNQISILIKLLILVLVAGIAIWSIMEESPVSKIQSYEKQPSSLPKTSRSYSQPFSSQPDADNDDVSLTGQKGQYDEARIGK
jgi:hypothetical protein